jgi:hypothetical protein
LDIKPNTENIPPPTIPPTAIAQVALKFILSAGIFGTVLKRSGLMRCHDYSEGTSCRTTKVSFCAVFPKGNPQAVNLF